MSDLIRRKSIKNLLCDLHIDNISINGKHIFEFIDELPTVGEWIPCSKRLPEETGEYLVWYDCGDEEGCMVVNFDAGIGSFGDWHDYYDTITLGFVDSEFIYCETAVAWMPLPEPYKGE